LIEWNGIVLVARKDVPGGGIAELVSYAKGNAGGLSTAIPASGIFYTLPVSFSKSRPGFRFREFHIVARLRS
jgi:hypothetical protein